jgi:plastocyanin
MNQTIGSTLRGVAARVFAIIALVFVAGCGGGAGAPEAATGTTTEAKAPETLATTPLPPAPGVFTISIENREYSHLAVPAGTQVNVVNRDDVEHSVTSDAPGLFDVHVQPHSEELFTAPSDPGTYPYHCVYHPAMHGELVVD